MTPEQMMQLDHAKMALKLAAHQWVLLFMGQKDTEVAECNLLSAARQFSIVCEQIDPRLWSSVCLPPTACDYGEKETK